MLQSGEASKTLQLVVSDTCVITRADRLPYLNGHKETGEGGGREERRAEGEEGEKGGRGGRGGEEGHQRGGRQPGRDTNGDRVVC